MIQTVPVIVEGLAVGVAVTHQAGWYFIATEPRLADLHGQIFSDLEAVRRVAGLVLARARTVPTTLPVLRTPVPLRVVRREDDG